jgi:hypothetical protein
VGEGKHSALSTVKIKNEWRYTSTPPICLHGVDRKNFTLYIRVKGKARRRKIQGSTLETKVKNLEGKAKVVDPKVFSLRLQYR